MCLECIGPVLPSGEVRFNDFADATPFNTVYDPVLLENFYFYFYLYALSHIFKLSNFTSYNKSLGHLSNDVQHAKKILDSKHCGRMSVNILYCQLI